MNRLYSSLRPTIFTTMSALAAELGAVNPRENSAPGPEKPRQRKNLSHTFATARIIAWSAHGSFRRQSETLQGVDTVGVAMREAKAESI
jgi:hypothetical protein